MEPRGSGPTSLHRVIHASSAGPGSVAWPGRRRRGREGVVHVWVVLILPVMTMFTGLAIDAGYLVWVGQELQSAADAAALAGVRQIRLSTTLARQAAHDIGALNTCVHQAVELDLNDGNAADGDIVIGRYDRETGVFDETASAINAIKIVARRTTGHANGPISLLFGPIMGFDTADIQREAIAMIGGGTGAGLITLSPHDPKSLYIQGSAQVTVNGGAIQVNSDSDPDAAYMNAHVMLDATAINCVGDIGWFGGTPITTADLNEGADPVPDPLADLPAPTWDPAADHGTLKVSKGTVTATPGYYSGGISASGGNITLQPGVYILDGSGLDIRGNTVFTAEGCMFYFIGTGVANVNGTGAVRITPPDPDINSGAWATTYEGITFFQARTNTNSGTINGTALMDLQGTLYFPKNHMTLGGTATKFGNQFIVYTVTITGTGNLTINYDGRYPAPGHSVFLVA